MSKADEEEKFFRDQMRGVKPIDHSKEKVKLGPPPITRKPKTTFKPDTENEFPFSDHIRETVTAETKLFFAQSGLQQKVVRSLRQGQIRQTQVLDLHGKTVNQARSALSLFLDRCLKNGDRCVRIVHGKGKPEAHIPILKNQVNAWLQQYPYILAFCSAVPHDGGTGAVYVLLKRSEAS